MTIVMVIIMTTVMVIITVILDGPDGHEDGLSRRTPPDVRASREWRGARGRRACLWRRARRESRA